MPDAQILSFSPAQPPRRRQGRRKTAAPVPEGIPFAVAWDSWEIALHSRSRSEGTIKSYRDTIELFAAWRTEHRMPDDVEAVTAEEIRLFLTSERERTSPGNAAKLFRNLRAFFRFLMAEGERTAPAPVQNADEPKVPEKELPPIGDEDIKAVLATSAGTSFYDRRDNALMRLLLDVGPRSSGLVGIRYTPQDEATHDVQLGKYRVRITLKGGDEYWAPIGKKTAQALDRYIRARARHPHAALPSLFIGRRGAMTRSGVQQMLDKRGELAGVRGVNPHSWRRTSATKFRRNGGSEEEAMHVYGWKSTAMVRHYTKSEARERAREAHAKYSPGDRF